MWHTFYCCNSLVFLIVSGTTLVQESLSELYNSARLKILPFILTFIMSTYTVFHKYVRRLCILVCKMSNDKIVKLDLE